MGSAGHVLGTEQANCAGHACSGHDEPMWNPYSSWLMLGLGCALSLVNGGRRSALHPGEIVTWSNLRHTTRWRENWPEAITEMVVISLIVSGAESLNKHGVGWWMFPLALVGLGAC